MLDRPAPVVLLSPIGNRVRTRRQDSSLDTDAAEAPERVLSALSPVLAIERNSAPVAAAIEHKEPRAPRPA